MKIMVVDDEPEMVKLIKILYDLNKHEILEADSGQSCLEMLEKGEIADLILLDIVMPKINGYDVCKKIKCDNRFKKIPVVMFSALAQEKNIEEGFRAGAYEYITKPFDPYELKEKVDGILDNLSELD